MHDDLTMTHRLISKSDGSDFGVQRYELEGDPGTFIDLDPTFETECDVESSHPMKERIDRIPAANRAKYIADKKLYYGATIKTRKTKEGWVDYLCWQCSGGEQHNYSQWTVSVAGDWTENVYDKFSEARAALEAIIGPTVLVRATKPKATEPETTEDPATGRRRWAACGHPAEYDINMDCYTCHHDPKETN